ncbi:hypothetical protein AVV01_gp54 [Mycobacterium phage Enkosi]|nr:hypothetical protein AVV01_gp54 [Mycobacterium phage Enkosi]ALF01431.1 hypothetical protein ENKOSI_54 [Mycobacterium phage Enkosi]
MSALLARARRRVPLMRKVIAVVAAAAVMLTGCKASSEGSTDAPAVYSPPRPPMILPAPHSSGSFILL